MERKRPSSCRSSKKQHSSKQNAEETSRKTRSMTGKNYGRMIYSEYSSSDEDEMVNSVWSGIENDYSYLHSTSKDGNSNEKPQDDSPDESLDVEVEDISFSDFDSTSSEEIFKTETKPVAFPSSPDLPSSRSSSPFLFWGRNTTKPKAPLNSSERDLALDGTEDTDGATARSTAKDTNNEIRSNDWDKWRSKAVQQKKLEKMKELKRSKIDDEGNASKKLRDKNSNENLLDAKFPPVTSVHKGLPKSQSDPGTTLKENRTRTSM